MLPTMLFVRKKHKDLIISLSAFSFFTFPVASPIQFKIQHPNLKILTSTLLIAYPGLTQEMLDYEIHVIREFVKSSQNA